MGNNGVAETESAVSFPWRDRDEIIVIRKIAPADFSMAYLAMLRTARLVERGRRLVFDDPAWRGIWLGAGEEKAVFLIVDGVGNAFALELLDRYGYREGVLAEGHYFADLYLPHLDGLHANGDAVTAQIFGLRYNGKARAREFIYGWTLADLHRPHRQIQHFYERASARIARNRVWFRAHHFARRFADAHDANLMVELLPVQNPEGKTHYGLPLPWRDAAGHLAWYLFRLTPIDVRPQTRPAPHLRDYQPYTRY